MVEKEVKEMGCGHGFGVVRRGTVERKDSRNMVEKELNGNEAVDLDLSLWEYEREARVLGSEELQGRIKDGCGGFIFREARAGRSLCPGGKLLDLRASRHAMVLPSLLCST